MRWHERRKLCATKNTKPTLTDQAGARDTDINVIVKRYTISGQAPGAGRPKVYADFTAFPQDLREMIDMQKNLEKLRQGLPENLRNLPLDQLTNLTTDQLTAMLPKPAEPPAPKDETK